jgi:hypothetical protein
MVNGVTDPSAKKVRLLHLGRSTFGRRQSLLLPTMGWADDTVIRYRDAEFLLALQPILDRKGKGREAVSASLTSLKGLC